MPDNTNNSGPPASRIRFSFPAGTESISEVRRLIVAEARVLPFSEEDLDDIALAISEAFTNLVQHSSGYRIRGACEVRPDQLEVRFEVERGMSRVIDRRQFPPDTAIGGRGIPLLNLLFPNIELRERADGATELRLVKTVKPNARRA